MNEQQTSTPPMDPDTSEADEIQLDLARRQGDAYAEAVNHMVEQVAQTGGQQQAGDYLIGFAIEEAEGMYAFTDGELMWQEPDEENLHVEVVVRDAGDGRFVPGCTVTVTLVDRDGTEVGTHGQPLLWHPMIYHYGRNWVVPGDGAYTVRVHVAPPRFMRHDEVNGRRFTDEVTVEFPDVAVTTGQD